MTAQFKRETVGFVTLLRSIEGHQEVTGSIPLSSIENINSRVN